MDPAGQNSVRTQSVLEVVVGQYEPAGQASFEVDPSGQNSVETHAISEVVFGQ